MTWIWSNYVSENLLPRIHGFEIMMASYAMAHLKLDLTLQETGFKNEQQQRLGIYLTNSLEEEHIDTWTLFANWLSNESNEANHIKKDMPIMTIIWNPPYNWESNNNWKWIMDLMNDYKKEPEWKEKLKEKNSKWINDDYVKFIRLAEHLIEKNWEWILAFINPHWFLDNPTFRWMRWKLLSDFDSIYTIDLHWNSKKKEVCPDWGIDNNVFDIQQWVSINFFIKNNKKKKWELWKVFHYDLYWKRDFKYNWLEKNDLKTVDFSELPNKAPNYFMVQKDFELWSEYEKWFWVNEIFKNSTVWVSTSRDNFVTDINRNELVLKISDFLDKELTDDEIKNKYLLKENIKFKINKARNLLFWDNIESNIKKYNYRVFDERYIYYKNEILERPREQVMIHFNKNNIWLIVNKQCRMNDYQHLFVTNLINDLHITETANANPYTFPLYLYQQNPLEQTQEKVPNFNMKIIEKIEKKLKLKLYEDFSPENLFDYIYSVLHSKTYRETYKEFLKIDFPKVPFDCDKNTFFKMVELWRELRSYHLMENENLIPKNFITTYPVDWDNLVEKVKYENENVFINDTQYFEWIPKEVWAFYIWGYQPSQKWLKDRKGRNLNYEDILHYSKIILCLKETIRIMEEIEGIFKV